MDKNEPASILREQQLSEAVLSSEEGSAVVVEKILVRPAAMLGFVQELLQT